MSARREARRAQLATAAPVVAGTVDVPAELLDPDHQAWHNQRAYHRFMAEHGWTMPPAERMGMTTAPSNRRQAAAAGWARDNGIVVTYGSPENQCPDLHQLRASGLID